MRQRQFLSPSEDTLMAWLGWHMEQYDHYQAKLKSKPYLSDLYKELRDEHDAKASVYAYLLYGVF